jgi:hypothetical protein
MSDSQLVAPDDTIVTLAHAKLRNRVVCLAGVLVGTSGLAWCTIHYLAPVSDSDDSNLIGRIGVILVGLAGWHLTQWLIGSKAVEDQEKAAATGVALTDSDRVLQATAPVNRYLLNHPKCANALLVVSSAFIDQLGVFLLLWTVVGPSLRPFVGLLILFGLRQVCQALTALPPPSGMIWRYPGFPSIFVTYGVSNDLFFSGHTALAVYGAVELARLGNVWLLALGIAIVVFEITTVLVLRAHYTLDVFTGLIAALFVAGVTMNLGFAS